jgi:hypothetical protein
MVLFKYLHKQHALNLVNGGIVRIGTLYEFRKEEEYGKIVGDREEGKKSARYIANDDIWTSSNIPNFAKNFFNLSKGGVVVMGNSVLEAHQQSDDYFIYCTTLSYDKDTMIAFGSDSCIRIENSEMFFSIISNTLISEGIYQGLHPCIYKKRYLPHYEYNEIHPAILKDPSFSYQQEIRALWKPRKSSISSKILMCPSICKYCSLVV